MKKMMIFLIILALCSACSVAVGSNIQPSFTEKKYGLQEKASIPESFFPEDLHIVALGDSLTEGIGDETKKGGYVPVFKEQLESTPEIGTVTIVNYGVKGNKTSDLLKRLNQEELSESIVKADMVVITIGGNDLMKVVKQNFLSISFEAFKKEEKKYVERLDTIIQMIREKNPDTHITLVGLYNPFMKLTETLEETDKVVDEWNRASEQILAKYEHTTFVPTAEIFKQEDENLLYVDEFHPNKKGYKLIAMEIFETLDTEPKPIFVFKR